MLMGEAWQQWDLGVGCTWGRAPARPVSPGSIEGVCVRVGAGGGGGSLAWLQGEAEQGTEEGQGAPCRALCAGEGGLFILTLALTVLHPVLS